MRILSSYIRITLAAVFILLAAQVVVYGASSTSGKSSSSGDNDKEISLKNISRYRRSATTVPSLNLSQFQYKGSSNFYTFTPSGNTLQVKTTIRLQSGNTTYVYPYRFKTKLQQVFKAPVQPVH